MRKAFRGSVLLVGAVILLAAATLGSKFLFVQPIGVDQRAEGVTVDLQSLGEYQANIIRLRLTEERTNNVVWELFEEEGIIPV